MSSVKLLSYALYIIIVYRPPSYTVEDNCILQSFLDNFCPGREVVILGDFNLPSLRWGNRDVGVGASSVDAGF